MMCFNTTCRSVLTSFVACTLLGLHPSNLLAWEPNAADLDKAVSSGKFDEYLTNLNTWLSQKAPKDASKITKEALTPILQDPAVALALAQRQFIAKVGAGPLGTFANADTANKTFVGWLLKN